jgi:hypothetical protein
METILQNPKDLILGVAISGVPVEGLTVLSSRTVQYGSYGVTFRIIGESHWVTLSFEGEIILEEVLACVKLSRPWSHEHSFADGQAHTFLTGTYAAHVSFQPFYPFPIPENSSYIQFAFPNPMGGTFVPFTRILWDCTESILRWKTLHVYPLERCVTSVLSESTYILKGGDIPLLTPLLLSTHSSEMR